MLNLAFHHENTTSFSSPHVHETSTIREVAVVFGFSSLAKEVMNGFGKGIK